MVTDAISIEVTPARSDADVELLQAIADPVRWAVLDALAGLMDSGRLDRLR